MSKTLADRTKATTKTILIIGDSGSGKTTLLGTAPDLYIADFDNGLDVLAGRADVHYDDYFDEPDKPAAWQALKATVKEWRKAPAHQTFGLDSLTTAGECALRYVLHKNGHNAARIQQGDWGEAISEVKDMLGFLTTLKCHVVVTAHYRIMQDEMGATYFVPLLYGKDLPHLVPKYFNDVWRTFVDLKTGQNPTPDYKLQVRPTAKFNTLKNTLGIGGMYAEPDFSKLLGGGNA